MNNSQLLSDFLGSLSVGEPVTFERLTLFPLRDGAVSLLSCITLEEALKRGAFSIGEIGGGTVPELLLKNGTDDRVFLLDGEELVGAKQNRILNTSLLVERNSEIRIPVSCVERGRWHFTDAARMSSSGVAHPALRGTKHTYVSRNLEAARSYASDQSEVWHEVDRKLAAMKVDSLSAALDAVHTKRSASLQEYAARFPCPETAIGVAAAIGGHLACIDLFATPDLLCRLWSRLVASYAMDAIEGEGNGHHPPDKRAVQVYLAAVPEPAVRAFPSPGLGTSVRFRDGRREGSALEVDGIIVHLEVFPTAESAGENEGTVRSRIARPSQRMRGQGDAPRDA